MREIWAVLTIGIVIGAAAPAIAADSDAELIARGHRIVETRCSRCHAVGKTGNSPLEKAPLFRELSKRYPLRYLEEALAEGIVTGHNEMPRFAFAPSDVEAIISYLGSISTR